MVDYEDTIYTQIATKLREEYDPIRVLPEPVQAIAAFPAVIITEMTNVAYEPSADSASAENHVRLMFEVNIYSNKVTGKKHESKQIRNAIDQEFLNMGFVRVFCQPVENLKDATIYRIVARYAAIVSTDGMIYSRR